MPEGAYRRQGRSKPTKSPSVGQYWGDLADPDLGHGQEHVLKPVGSLERDEAADEVNHGQVVAGQAPPSDEQSTESHVPAVGAFDDPAPQLATCTADQR
jgi:hypothetical protein